MSEEAKVYGLLHVATALGFLNRDGQSVHGGLRTSTVWTTPGGEWKLGGMEVTTRLDEADGALWVRRFFLPFLGEGRRVAPRGAIRRAERASEPDETFPVRGTSRRARIRRRDFRVKRGGEIERSERMTAQ